MSAAPPPPRRPGFPARLPSLGNAQSSPPVRAAAPAAATASGWGLDSAAVRQRMVQRLAAGGIQSPLVLQAMGQVPRHGFVDSALVAQAYEDTSLPIGWQQTISKPSVVARMIELLLGAPLAQQHGLGRVLEIGTGGRQSGALHRAAAGGGRCGRRAGAAFTRCGPRRHHAHNLADFNGVGIFQIAPAGNVLPALAVL